MYPNDVILNHQLPEGRLARSGGQIEHDNCASWPVFIRRAIQAQAAEPHLLHLEGKLTATTENLKKPFLWFLTEVALPQLVLRIIDSVLRLAEALEEVWVRRKLGFLAIAGGVCKG